LPAKLVNQIKEDVHNSYTVNIVYKDHLEERGGGA